MSEDTPQNQAPEQKIIRLEEGVVPPRLILPDVDVQKGMVPVNFIPPVIQQTAQTDAVQAPQQTGSTPQSTPAPQTQTADYSQPNPQNSQEAQS